MDPMENGLVFSLGASDRPVHVQWFDPNQTKLLPHVAKLACSIVSQVAMNQTNMDVLSCKDFCIKE